MATLDEAVGTLNLLAEELRLRREDVETFEHAYRGKHKLHYASKDFQEFYADRYAKFSDNWCGIVADAPHERLEVTGIRVGDETEGDVALWETWRRNDADAYSDLAFLDAIIAKRSYALVWGSGDDDALITWEHPAQAIVGYDPETRQRRAGAKVWADETTEYATLYLPDEVWKFQRPRINAVTMTTESGLYVPTMDGRWSLRDGTGRNPIPNPMGKVPLVEFPNRPRLVGEPLSDIAGTLSMQHAVNLIWSQLFVALDSASWPQRVIYGAEMPTIPVLDENGQEIGERPIDLKKFAQDRAIWLEDPNVKISEWSATNLKAYTDIIEIAVGHIAAQTRTPSHYLLIGGTIANISSDAMKALETGLVKRTQEKTQHFGRAARDVFELVALAQNDSAKAVAIRTSGQVLWKDVENRSDAQRADALQKKAAIGYPLEYLLELDGLPPAEIQRVLKMREAEQTDALTRAVIDGVNRDAAGPSLGK